MRYKKGEPVNMILTAKNIRELSREDRGFRVGDVKKLTESYKKQLAKSNKNYLKGGKK